MSAAHAGAIKDFLSGVDVPEVGLSKRAKPAIDELRSAFRWLKGGDQSDIVEGVDGQTWWWTFAGTDANVELAAALGDLAPVVSSSGLAIRVEDGLSPTVVEAAMAATENFPPPDVPADLAEAWKFADALPDSLVERLLDRRLRDPHAVRATRAAPIHGHSLASAGPRP